MNTITIEESGMTFGEYRENNVFYIEKSRQYTKSLRQHRIKSCEFLLLRKKKIHLIEAKSSLANFYESESTEEKRIQYEVDVDEIVQKMKDSLMLYANIVLERCEQEGVPEEFLNNALKNNNIVFVLVIKNAKKEWLAPYTDVFRNKLHNEMRIWGIQSFLVINEEMARKSRFIL